MCEKHYRRWQRTGSTADPAVAPVVACTIDGCEKPKIARGWCRTHYRRWYETGSTGTGFRKIGPRRPLSRRPLEDRFWEKVLKGPNHWLWAGGTTTLGYGTIWDGERNAMAHRVSWEIAHGEKIPPGLVIDHLCRLPKCVNPAHLEVVTISVNTSRGRAGEVGGAKNRAKTHCPQGHPYSPENTYYYKDGKVRVCRECAITRTIERRKRLSQSA